MSNLNNNTTQLEALLAKVNALPEAGGGTDTSDATATADEIFAGETAYTADGKVTGTFTIDDELTTQDNLIEQIQTVLQGKAAGGGGNITTCTVTSVANDNVSYGYKYVYMQADDGYLRCIDDYWSGDSQVTVLCNSIIELQEAYNENTGEFIENISVESSDGTSFTQYPLIFIGTSNTTITFLEGGS